MRGARRGPARLGARASTPAPRRRDFARAARAEAAARGRGRSISRSPRSRRCAAIPMRSMRSKVLRPRSARSAAARSRRGRARHAVPRDPASLRARRASIRRAADAVDVLLAIGARSASTRRRCPPMSTPSGGRASSMLAAEHRRLGANERADTTRRAIAEARRRGRPRSAHRRDAVAAMPTGSTSCPAGWPTSSTTRPARRPSKVQAHRLLAPQLALEGALLKRGAFRELGVLTARRPRLCPAEGERRGRCRNRSSSIRRQRQDCAPSCPRKPGRGWSSCSMHYDNPDSRLSVARPAVPRRRYRRRLRPSRARARMVGRRRRRRTGEGGE